MNWLEIMITAWFAVQLMCVALIVYPPKQFSFALGKASSGETAGSGHSPPAPALNLLVIHPNHSITNHSTTSSSAIPSAAKIKSMGAFS